MYITNVLFDTGLCIAWTLLRRSLKDVPDLLRDKNTDQISKYQQTTNYAALILGGPIQTSFQ